VTKKTTALISGAILAVAAGVLALIFSTEPTATRGGATKETAMLVDFAVAERGTYRPTIEAMGSVEPARDVVLGPRVAGEVAERSPAFDPGGFVEKGEVLLRIDPADYRNRLAQAESDLHQALADLELEKGRQTVARKDYELLDKTLAPENEALVLRRPQMEAMEARVESARAAVEQAELDLERTTVRAPFDAHVLSREVDVGSQVAPGDALGRVVAVDVYWVIAAVPLTKLRFLAIPSAPGETGSTVRIRNRTAWPEGVARTGRVDRLLNELADQTRMARVLVTVTDPLARNGDPPDAPPLMIGSYVEARIEGEPIQDVVRLDRDYLRTDDTVWVMADGRLSIRDAEVVFRDARYAYLAGGVEEGEQVVTTNLATVVDGARLRVEGADGSSGAAGEDGAEQDGEGSE